VQIEQHPALCKRHFDWIFIRIHTSPEIHTQGP